MNLKILKLNSINDFVVISDVHLRDPDDKLTEIFISTLNSLPKIDAVFLLGDIFDFISAKNPYFLKLWENVFQSFKDLKNKGVQIYFIEGNHDFGFEHFKSSFLNSCFHSYGDFIVEFTHSKLGVIHLRHGDDVVCQPNYLKFRNFVKSKYFQRFASFFIPGWFMQFIFSRYAKISRKKDAYRTLSEDFLQSCLEATTKIYPYINILVLGHIHMNRDCKINEDVRFLVGPDWLTKPSYLIYNEELGFERKFLSVETTCG